MLCIPQLAAVLMVYSKSEEEIYLAFVPSSSVFINVNHQEPSLPFSDRNFYFSSTNKAHN